MKENVRGNCASHGLLKKPPRQCLEAEWDPAKEKSPHKQWRIDDKNQGCKRQCYFWTWYIFKCTLESGGTVHSDITVAIICASVQGVLSSEVMGVPLLTCPARGTDPSQTQGKKGVCRALLWADWNLELFFLETLPPSPWTWTPSMKHTSNSTWDHSRSLWKRFLTRVCTIWGLWSRKLFTAWNTSKSPSALTRSRMLLSAMKVPVRPAPALQRKRAGWDTQTHPRAWEAHSLRQALHVSTGMTGAWTRQYRNDWSLDF